MNIALPEESLMLLKPSGGVPHDGGTVMKKDDARYATVLKWIQEGAVDDPDTLPTLTGIEILPKEAVLEGENQNQHFVVMATYSDGTDRDVTDMAILASSDESTMKMAPDGVVTSGGSESLITALYSYRELARETRGVTQPNVVMPKTAHVALDDPLVSPVRVTVNVYAWPFVRPVIAAPVVDRDSG